MHRRDRARSIRARQGRQTGSRFAVLAAAIALGVMTVPGQWQAGAVAADTGGSSDGLEVRRPQPPLALTLPALNEAASPDDLPANPGPAARSLVSAGTALDKVRAQQCLTMAIYYEAARESDDGQRAVAQVVLNRVAHPSYPDTVCGVVFQGSERSTGCQFTFTCDGAMARKPSRIWWDRASKIAQAALAGSVHAPVGLATHYHTTEVNPYWASSLQPVGRIGAHVFYRWKGAAGSKAAFASLYRGGEPDARPHSRSNVPTTESGNTIQLALAYDSDRVELSAPATFAPASANTAAPAYSEDVERRGGESLFRAVNLPSGGEIAPAYRRSGEWISQP